MSASTEVALNNAVIAAFGIAAIPFIATLIIFFLWLYFGFGTLTRLTDIKNKLDELIEAVKHQDHLTNESREVVHKEVAAITTQTQRVITPNVIQKGISDLKKPSKVFVWILVGVCIVFVILLAIAYLIGQK